MEEIKILEASDVKLEDYKNLRLEALRAEPQAFGSSYNDQKNALDSDWQQWLENYKAGERNWMIFASNGEKLVGMLGAFQNDEDEKNQQAQIIAVYVTKSARGKGIATLLLQRLLDKLTHHTAIQKVRLCVNVDQIAAIKLYQHFGFTIAGKENTVLGDGINHEEYLMEKDLT